KLSASFMRVGSADKQVVARLYLPGPAAHNMALAGYLSVLEHPRVMGAVVGTPGGGAAGPQTAAEKIKKRISLAFPRNTLEVSMQMLAEEIGLPITIIGGDLQLEGITKNQSFGLDQ